MSQNETATVDVTIDDKAIATIALNRPEVRNAVNETLRAELVAALERVAQDDTVRAVVLTGNGPAFCAGGDLAAMQQNAAAPAGKLGFNGWRRQRRLHSAVGALHGLTKPTIAAVNGPAFGLGCDLAMCCDFVIAAESASFAMNFLYRGLVPDGGGLYFMPRRVGLARAKELIFSGRRVTPQEALDIGMIDRLTSAANLLADARAWAAELSGGSLTALALTKEILDRTFELGAEEVFALGRQAQAICYTTDEHRDAVAAFLAKSAAKSAAKPSGA